MKARAVQTCHRFEQDVREALVAGYSAKIAEVDINCVGSESGLAGLRLQSGRVGGQRVNADLSAPSPTIISRHPRLNSADAANARMSRSNLLRVEWADCQDGPLFHDDQMPVHPSRSPLWNCVRYRGRPSSSGTIRRPTPRQPLSKLPRLEQNGYVARRSASHAGPMRCARGCIRSEMTAGIPRPKVARSTAIFVSR